MSWVLPSTVGRQRVFLFPPAESPHALSWPSETGPPFLQEKPFRASWVLPSVCVVSVLLLNLYGWSPGRSPPCPTSSAPTAFPAWPQFVGLTTFPLPLWDFGISRQCCLFPPLLNPVGESATWCPLTLLRCLWSQRTSQSRRRGAFLELLEE